MGTLLACEAKKLRRSKILLVALFGMVMILLIVAAQGFYAGSDAVYGMEPAWFLTGVPSLGTLYAVPGLIALFGCYLFCRELQEDVLKSIRIIPVDIPKMLAAKMILVFVFSVSLYFLLFLAAFGIEAALHVQTLSLELFCKYCRMYLIEGVCIFIAVLPIICIVIRSGQDYWLGLLLSEVYSFITIFIGNLGAVSKLYPILAALTLSGYYESDLTEKFLCLLSMILCLLLSAILMGWHGKKAE